IGVLDRIKSGPQPAGQGIAGDATEHPAIEAECHQLAAEPPFRDLNTRRWRCSAASWQERRHMARVSSKSADMSSFEK
ncbi:MAG: hypothetical protein RL242_1859, partial [Pseudomonadota bacterium]